VAVASGREEWWRVTLWPLAALGLIALFVLGETIIAAVFTQVVFSGADSGSEQFTLPAGGLGLGILLLALSIGGIVARRQSPVRPGRPRGAITIVVLVVLSAISCISWAVAGIALLVSRWPDLWSSPSGHPVSPTAWPALVGVVAYLIAAGAHAALCVHLIGKGRVPRAGSGRRRLVEDAV
jgi:membrane protease YdiL (CAAX protease family)